MWIFTAFLGPFFHSAANILDSHLTNDLFKRKSTLIFYATLFGFLFVPLLFLFGFPRIPGNETFLIYCAIAVINVGYLYPYYKALEGSDTSIVTSLFSIGNLFVPILAYFIVGEVLTPIQYVGVIMVVITSIMLGIEKGTTFKLSSAFWWMLLCSFILSLEAVLYKYSFISEDWITSFFWPALLSLVLVLPFLFFTQSRSDIVSNRKRFIQKFPIFGLEEFATFLGSSAGTYATSVAPVTIVSIIGETQALFVLLWAKAFGKHASFSMKENMDSKSISRKIILFVLMVAAIALVLWGK